MCYTRFDTQENLSIHREYAKYRRPGSAGSNYNDNHIIAHYSDKNLIQLHDNYSSYSKWGFTFIYQKLTNILQIKLFLI